MTIKEFLTKHKDLLDANNFDALYEELRQDTSRNFLTSSLTALLYSADIDPIKYFSNTIPKYFFFDYITSIKALHLNINPPEEIILPNNIRIVEKAAFQQCDWLKKIVFKNKDLVFGEICFYDIPDLTIEYPGTKVEFLNCKFPSLTAALTADNPFARSSGIIKCSDFDIPLNHGKLNW